MGVVSSRPVWATQRNPVPSRQINKHRCTQITLEPLCLLRPAQFHLISAHWLPGQGSGSQGLGSQGLLRALLQRLLCWVPLTIATFILLLLCPHRQWFTIASANLSSVQLFSSLRGCKVCAGIPVLQADGAWERRRPGTLILTTELLPLPVLGLAGSVVHTDLLLL